ncbi:hypothetical protein DL96DRAFT_1575860 [Flagelloscypha sp. PMI_526]|nr:hypothetical protein DL96DRAFT_1575860 [Flagelloscypha sp. PMI_526]
MAGNAKIASNVFGYSPRMNTHNDKFHEETDSRHHDWSFQAQTWGVWVDEGAWITPQERPRNPEATKEYQAQKRVDYLPRICAHWAAGIGRDDWRYSEILDTLAKETNNAWPLEPSITPSLLFPLNEFDVGYHQNVADWEVEKGPSTSKPFSYATAVTTAARVPGRNATSPQVQVVKPKRRNHGHRKILGKTSNPPKPHQYPVVSSSS